MVKKRPRNMQKKKDLKGKVKPYIDAKKFRIGPAEGATEKINVYRCRECGGEIITIQRGEAVNGVTSMFLVCRATEGCEGSMVSAMYRVPQFLKPTHEWYKPDKLPEDDEGLRRHIEMGGLLIRQIEKEGENGS